MQMFASLVYILCALQGAVLVTCQQVAFRRPADRSPILDDDFSAWIEETGKDWAMKGVSVAVVRKNSEGEEGWMTETTGYGVADRRGNAVDEETLFSIGSNSKLFTAIAVGILAENSSTPFTWNSKIKDVVPHAVWGLQYKVAEDCEYRGYFGPQNRTASS